MNKTCSISKRRPDWLVRRHERLSLLKSGSILHCKAARVETGNGVNPVECELPDSGSETNSSG